MIIFLKLSLVILQHIINIAYCISIIGIIAYNAFITADGNDSIEIHVCYNTYVPFAHSLPRHPCAGPISSKPPPLSLVGVEGAGHTYTYIPCAQRFRVS